MITHNIVEITVMGPTTCVDYKLWNGQQVKVSQITGGIKHDSIGQVKIEREHYSIDYWHWSCINSQRLQQYVNFVLQNIVSNPQTAT